MRCGLSRTVLPIPGKSARDLPCPTKSAAPVEQDNVVGEIRGYEKPDEVVILGAHLDSWDLGTGALDNGCNAALVIEAARAHQSHWTACRAAPFALFCSAAKSKALLGSWEYVKAHRAELDKIRAVIIFDSGIGRVTRLFAGRPARHSKRACAKF